MKTHEEPDFNILEVLAKQIIQARIKRGFTQDELAKRIGTRQPAIARLESGEYNPRVRYLVRLAKAMGMSLEIKFK